MPQLDIGVHDRQFTQHFYVLQRTRNEILILECCDEYIANFYFQYQPSNSNNQRSNVPDARSNFT